jgi:hypothetical protein
MSTSVRRRLTSRLFGSTDDKTRTSIDHAQTVAVANGHANGNIIADEKSDELVEYVRLDQCYDSTTGNWVLKRTEPPVVQKGDEFSMYSFSVQRSWDKKGLFLLYS